MEIRKEKIIENLVRDGVIIATQEYLVRDGDEQKIGDIYRESYGNWESDRKRLTENEPEKIVNAVMTIWGDSSTVFLEEQQNASIVEM
ncbi:MAG: hypothetical protein K2K70_09365 [Lachnospiraceae bacterium]|nr:hypothetical protein [Lachnospiraceae bacterium]